MNTETTTTNAARTIAELVAEKALRLVWDAIEAKDCEDVRWGVSTLNIIMTEDAFAGILAPVGGHFSGVDRAELEGEVMDAVLTSVPDAVGAFALGGGQMQIRLRKLWTLTEWLTALSRVKLLKDETYTAMCREWRRQQYDALANEEDDA